MTEVKERVMAICQSLSSVNAQSSSAPTTAFVHFPHPTPPSWIGGAVPLPPVPDSVTIHPFLDGETPRSNYLFNLSWQYSYPMQLIDGQRFRLSDDTLSQLATYPPMYFLRIVCDAIPDWSMIIEFDPDSHPEQMGRISPYVPPLTLGDILYQIHRTLHERITHAEWEDTDPAKRSKVNEAYLRRCKSEGPTEQERLKNDGVKKVDYLLDKIWFKGLIRTGAGREMLKLMVSSYN